MTSVEVTMKARLLFLLLALALAAPAFAQTGRMKDPDRTMYPGSSLSPN